MIVVDTDVLIDALRGREPSRSRVAGSIEGERLVTTAVNAFELRCGAISTREREKVDALLGAASILPLDDESALAAASIHRELSAAGQRIGMADSLIAGICRHHSLPLLTRNHSHFERVSGLRLADLG